MITGSSRDYGTGIVTIVYDQSEPSPDQVHDYCVDNYGFPPDEYTVDAPTEYRGLSNPGIITCRPVSLWSPRKGTV